MLVLIGQNWAVWGCCSLIITLFYSMLVYLLHGLDTSLERCFMRSLICLTLLTRGPLNRSQVGRLFRHIIYIMLSSFGTGSLSTCFPSPPLPYRVGELVFSLWLLSGAANLHIYSISPFG